MNTTILSHALNAVKTTFRPKIIGAGFLAALGIYTTATCAAGVPLFVLNSLDANISVIDTGDWHEIKKIPTGKEPHHLYLTPDEKSVIVANAGS